MDKNELETVEELDDTLEDVLEEEKDDDSLSESKYASSTPFYNSSFPVIFINKKFKILFTNPACDQLLHGFSELKGRYLTNVFGKFFEMQDLHNIRDVVLNGTNDYSWKGEFRIKSREMSSVQIKVFLCPADPGEKNPDEFVLLLDDVTEENRQHLRIVFLSLLEASKLKDNDTGQHITRVNFYSSRLAKELFNKPGYERIDTDFIDNIGFLASMHDVGKIGTPDDILNKEGPLSDWEWKVMQEHTKNGAFIFSTYPNPMAKEIALSHHERWNGTGYPFKLEGNMIPLAARIVSISDVYDALRMRRSYKPAYDHPTAVSTMMETKGTQFDPDLIDVFYVIAEDFNKIYEDNKDIA